MEKGPAIHPLEAHSGEGDKWFKLCTLLMRKWRPREVK